MNKLRIFLVDDEPLLLESLEIILTMNGMEIAGMAREGGEALRLLKESFCDMALVDLNMKGMGGIELIGHMKERYPDVKILVLTTFYDDKNITQAIAGGADGYLLKDSGKEAILGAIEQIMGGRNVVDSKVMQRLAMLMSGRAAMRSMFGAEENNGFVGANTERESITGVLSDTPGSAAGAVRELTLPEDITWREKEICSLLAKGYTNRQIADTLYISEGTVKNYISSIYDKTGIHDRAKLIVEMNRYL